MAKLVRIGIGVLVRAGTVLCAYLLLSPAIWSRSDFDGAEYAVALAAVSSWGSVGRTAGPLGRWVRNETLFSIGFAATVLAGCVLLGALSGEGTLTSVPQRIAFGIAAAVSACFWFGLQRLTRFPAFTDPEGESRRAAIRSNIRLEIEEIERSAGKAARSPTADDH